MKNNKYKIFGLAFLLFFLCVNVSAQSNVKKVAYSTEANQINFSFEVNETETYTVKVINSGKIKSMPIRKETYSIGSIISFDLNTKYWKPGNYEIILENSKKIKSTQKLVIAY